LLGLERLPSVVKVVQCTSSISNNESSSGGSKIATYGITAHPFGSQQHKKALDSDDKRAAMFSLNI
jgi:hypothetical protein